MDGHEKRGLVSQAPAPIDCLPRVCCVICFHDGFVHHAAFLDLIAHGAALALLQFLHVRIGGGGGQDSRPPLRGCTWRYRVAQKRGYIWASVVSGAVNL